MSDPVAAREALMIEAIGEVGSLIQSVQALTSDLQEIGTNIEQAEAHLRETLGSFEPQLATIINHAKIRAVQYVAARAEEAAKRSIEAQSRAMVEAAQAAFGAELSANLRRLKALVERRRWRWEPWLTHAAAASTAVATWMLAEAYWVP